MKLPCSWFFIGLAITWPVLPLRAQEPPPPWPDAFHMVAEAELPNDWTHRHVVFSAASSEPELRSIAEREPRYWLQLLRNRGSQDAFSADAENAVKIAAAQLERLKQLEQWRGERDPVSSRDESLESESWRRGRPSHRREPLRRDWSQTFSNGTTYTFNSPTYPAKFSLSSANPTPDCAADYVAFTLPTGSSVFPGSFNIVAFNNLYVTTAGGAAFCSGTAPQAIFAYNASTAGGPLNGSPALSLDGTLIAFVENATVPNGGAVFHVLKWHSGDTQRVDASFPNAFNSAVLANCAANGAVAPCEYNVQYTPAASAKTVTLSSPFVDYTNDTAYVSDDGGNVYAIAPVFTATSANPPKVQTGWPVNVVSNVVLTPPVYDSLVQIQKLAGSGIELRTTLAK